jgi:site-specific DNA recombinase
MTTVVGYSRVSTASQADQGSSLEAQKAKIAAYAVALELNVIASLEDASSAGSLDRPGLKAALTLLECGAAQGIVIAKLDRLTRSVKDLGYLIDRYFGEKFALFSVGDSIDTRSAGGRLVLNVLASVSQWEREAIGERTKETLAHLRSQGL